MIRWWRDRHKRRCARGYHVIGDWHSTIDGGRSFRVNDDGETCKHCDAFDWGKWDTVSRVPVITIRYEIIYAP